MEAFSCWERSTLLGGGNVGALEAIASNVAESTGDPGGSALWESLFSSGGSILAIDDDEV